MSRKVSSSAPAASYATAASTGSPASRRSTKLTPLTTRPSFTSRKGMTRTLNMNPLPMASSSEMGTGSHEGNASKKSSRGARAADQCQRGRRIEPTVIERPPCDRPFQLLCPWRQHRLDVFDRGETARGDDGNGNGIGQRNGRVEIEALQEAVAGDIGEDDGGDAGILKAFGDFECRDLRGLGPAFDRDLAVARIEADGHAAGKFFRGALDQLGIAHRCGTDDHPRDALVEPGFHGPEIADAATELHRHADDLQHRLDSLRIDRLARKGAVEIDHMQVFKALRREAPGLRRGIEVEHGR